MKNKWVTLASFSSILLISACSESSTSPVANQGSVSSESGLSSITPNPLSSSSALPLSSQLLSSSSVLVSSAEQLSSSAVVEATELLVWETDYGAAVSSGGYWFAYDDKKDNGVSNWLCAEVIGEYQDPVDDCFQEDGSLTIDFNIDPKVPNGENEPYGFAGLGFNFLEEVEGEKMPFIDAKMYKGIEIVYSSTEDIYLQVVYDEVGLKYDVHRQELKAGDGVEKYFLWSDFKQAGWGVKGDLLEHLAELKEVKFQAHSENFSGEGKLTIHSVILK